MGMTLTLVQGATTVTLSGDGATILGCRFFPAVAEPQATFYTPGLGDGGELLGSPRQTTIDDIEVYLEGTAAAIRAQVQSIEMMILDAERKQKSGIGDRLYLTYTAATGEDAYRTEVLAGSLVWPKERDRRQLGGSENTVAVTLLLYRRPYWEGDQVEIALSNALDIPTTGGQDIVNTPDSVGVANWVHIADTEIVGAVPAPLTLKVKNTASGNRDETIWAAVATGRAATGLALLGIDATGSGTWAVDPWTSLWTWDLTTAMLAKFQGEWFQSLVKFSATPAAAYQMRWVIQLAVTAIWTSQAVRLDTLNQLQPCGAVQLPPYLVGETDLYPLKLVLQAKYTGGGSLTTDYVQFMVADNLRKYVPSGYGLAQNVILTDDADTGLISTDGWGTAGKTGHYVVAGAPLMVRPGEEAMIHVMHRETTGAAGASRGSDIRAYYRPRRLSI